MSFTSYETTKVMKSFIALLTLFLCSCASCDYEETHAFLKKNPDFLTEICYTVHSPEKNTGNYCLRRL